MPDNVSIAYRGATYALGQGPQFYGIWYAAAPQSQPQPQPLEWWPLTPEGWAAAWSRFASVEAPGTIRPVTQPPVAPMTGATGPVSGRPSQAAAGAGQDTGAAAPWSARPEPGPATLTRVSPIAPALIGVGLVLGIVGLFPVYAGGVSLASQPFNVVAHAIYLAGWTLAGVLILLGGVRVRAGALLGLGLSAVTLGLFVADVGIAAAGPAHLTGAGLVLSFLGWLGCTAGAAVAATAARQGRRGLTSARGLAARFTSQPSHDIVPLVTLILAAVGAAIAFAPSWDSFTLRTASGASQSVTAGNVFSSSNPGAVIFGDVLAMIAIVAVIVLAAMWRPLRLGAALALGAAIPLVAQAISAIVQASEPVSPAQFGITPSQARQLGLTIESGLTAMFWVYCAFVGTLILLCAWMLTAHGPVVGSPLMPGSAAPMSGGPAAGGQATGVSSGPAASAAGQGPADTAGQGPADTAGQGPADTAGQGPADTANQGPADTANQGPADTAAADRGPLAGG